MQTKSEILLIAVGDSITDAARDRNGDSTRLELMGEGYVRLFAARHWARHSAAPFCIMNKGIGGDTTRDLLERWEKDVLCFRPDIVTLMVGINDAMREVSRPQCTHIHISEGETLDNLTKLVQGTTPRATLILLSPFYMETDPTDPVRARIDRQRAFMKELAARENCVYVDTQALFDRILAVRYPTWLAHDRVHPNLVGHTIIADALLEAVEQHMNGKGRLQA